MAEREITVDDLSGANGSAPAATIAPSEPQSEVVDEINAAMRLQAMITLLQQMAAQARADGNSALADDLEYAIGALRDPSNHNNLSAMMSSVYGLVSLANAQRISGNQTLLMNIQVMDEVAERAYLETMGKMRAADVSDEDQIEYYERLFRERGYTREELEVAQDVSNEYNLPENITLEQRAPLQESVVIAAHAEPDFAAAARRWSELSDEEKEERRELLRQRTASDRELLAQAMDRDDLTAGQLNALQRVSGFMDFNRRGNNTPAPLTRELREYVQNVIAAETPEQLNDATNGISHALDGINAARVQAIGRYRDELPESRSQYLRGTDAVIMMRVQQVDEEDLMRANAVLSDSSSTPEQVRQAHETRELFAIRYMMVIKEGTMALDGIHAELERVRETVRTGGTVSAEAMASLANFDLLLDRNAPMEARVAVLEGRESLLGNLGQGLSERSRTQLYTYFITRADDYPGGMQQALQDIRSVSQRIAAATTPDERERLNGEYNALLGQLLMPTDAQGRPVDFSTLSSDALMALITHINTNPTGSREEFNAVFTPFAAIGNMFSESEAERVLKASLLAEDGNSQGGRIMLDQITSVAAGSREMQVLAEIAALQGNDDRLGIREINQVMSQYNITFSQAELANGIDGVELAHAVMRARGESVDRTP